MPLMVAICGTDATDPRNKGGGRWNSVSDALLTSKELKAIHI
jgi:hypothetical protein